MCTIFCHFSSSLAYLLLTDLSALLTNPSSIDKKLFSVATDRLLSFTDEFLFTDKKSVSNF
ncbi:hypothetical protein FGL73_06355 [Lactococcus lactis]|nr:hypothetical protein [Lactococcus lactis]QEA61138.1 hypothetical protein FGL73_06355 [Lactococcus lactis]